MAILFGVATAAALSWLVHFKSSPRSDIRRIAIVEKQSSTSAEFLASSPPLDSRKDKPVLLETKIESGPNAANDYKDAFVLYDRLTEEEKKTLANQKTMPDPETAKALAKKIRPILELLRQAAAEPKCDWGYGQVSFDTPMPQISKINQLGKLALWDATYQFPTDPGTALDDLEALRQLGHNGSDLLIGATLERGLEGGANEVIRQNAGSLTAEGLAQALLFLQTGSPLLEDTMQSLQGESEFVRASSQRLVATASEMSPEQFAQAFPNNTAQIRQVLNDPAAWNAQFEHISAIEKKFGETLAWSESDYQAWWQDVVAQAKDSPIEAAMIPVLDATRNNLQRAQTRRAMLTAGLEVMQSGPGALSSFPDPSTGSSFSYTASPQGFELQSKIVRDGQPITMSFPMPAAGPGGSQ